jgi:hypothetical protein
MSSKVCGKAHRCKTIRDSGIFEDNPSLNDSLLVAVSHGVYVLFKRVDSSYYFIRLTPDGYDLLHVLHDSDRLELSQIVGIIESLSYEEITWQ